MAAGGAATPALDLPPLTLRDKGMKPVLRLREHQFKGYASTGEPNTVPCRIRYTDKYFGYLKDRDYYFQEKFRLQSSCYDAQKFEGLESIPHAFDAERREWVPDLEKRLKWAATAIGQEELDPAYKKLRRDALRAYTLKSVNAQGFAFTEEEVIGDEKSRVRYLDYCLFYAEMALCGRGEVGYVADGPKGDLTDYVLQILRSIEFLPTPPPTPPSMAASASAVQGSVSAPTH
jgi:hypothetical protein